MEKKLQFLESFPVRDADGNVHRVRVYEHLARLDVLSGQAETWESTGLIEYKLADGRHVDVGSDGTLTLRSGGIRLDRTALALHAGAA